MKKLLLITVLLVVATTKLIAQNKEAIEIKKNENEISKKENNEFKIVAHEEVDVNLKINLKKEETINLLILDNNKKIVFSREYYKEGENKIAFTMNEDEQYSVKVSSPKQPTNVIVCMTEN